MRQLLPWLIVGLLLRLWLMATVVHPDIRGHNLAAYLISQQGQAFTFYDYLRQLPRNNQLVQVYGDGLFIYPPLAYWTHALFMAILGPIYPWRAFETLIYDMGQLRQAAGLLVLLKIPYLVADGVGLWLIIKVVDKKSQFLAGMLWIFNPVTIWASYLIGQFDIFIAVGILAAVVLAQRHKLGWAAAALGLAAGFKPFPLLLSPFLGANWREKVKLVGITIFTYGLQVAPFLDSVGFKHYALLANQADKLWYAKIMVSASQYLPLFAVGLGLLLWWNYFRPKALPVWGWFGAMLLLFYAVTHYHPQWFVWIVPLLIVGTVLRPATRWPAAVLVVAWMTVLFSFESSLNFGLFGLPWSAAAMLGDQVVSTVRGVLAATALVWVWETN